MEVTGYGAYKGIYTLTATLGQWELYLPHSCCVVGLKRQAEKSKKLSHWDASHLGRRQCASQGHKELEC